MRKKQMETEKQRFSKEEILRSGRYRECSDLVDALLEADGAYTLREVKEKTERFLKGKVSEC